MYRLSYAEVIDESGPESRHGEGRAFDQVIAKLEEGESAGCSSVRAIEAMHFLKRLWIIFMDDLSGDENGLPEKLRASLVSIGIWMLKECERVSRGEVTSLRDMIDINVIVRNGLR